MAAAQQRDIGNSLATERQQWQRQRRWRQRDSATLAEVWRWHGGGGSAKRGGGAQRDGGSAVAAARRLR